MKNIVNDTVQLTKYEEILLIMTQEELANKFASMKAGTYEDPNGSEFDAVAYYDGQKSANYIRLCAPWSPNNKNICWKLEVFAYDRTRPATKPNFEYVFRTVNTGTMEWYIMSNLMYVFPTIKKMTYINREGLELDPYSDEKYFIITQNGSKFAKISKINSLEKLMKYYDFEV